MTCYESENEKISQIQREAEGRGNDEFYEHLTNTINSVSTSWEQFQIDEKLSMADHTKLIEKKHNILKFIERHRNSDS